MAQKLVILLALCWSAASVRTAAAAQALPETDAIDGVFSEWTTETPGCAIGVRHDDRTIVRAYGQADLERDIPNTSDTIFEAASASKQFTAAAVLLLARDGKLSLDDPIQKHLPEMPDYGQPLTIRHLLHHTSGLRDWGSIVAVGGWPRGTRVYTQAHVLDIAARQRRLNFVPGTRWSYTNTGYNLAAIIVERVSGVSFDAFTKARIFEPLGMSQTSWRSDHTRIVRNRAVAYSRGAEGFRIDTPIEDVYGNAGLLTTVTDLLKWNANFEDPVVGDSSFVAEMQTSGLLSNGQPHAYALGLSVRDYRGVPEIGHDGATAGYTANLVRFPDRDLSIAILCNSENAVAPRYTYAIADLFLSGDLTASQPVPSATYALSETEVDLLVGVYRSTLTGMPLMVSADGGSLVARLRWFTLTLSARSSTQFASPFGVSWEFVAPGDFRMMDQSGLVEVYRRADPARAGTDQLQEFAGWYSSDEADVSFRVEVDASGALVMTRRPSATFVLSPVYANAFSNPELGLILFRPDATGAVQALSVVQDRMWDLRFERVANALGR